MDRSGLFVAPVPGDPPAGASPLDARIALAALVGTTGACLAGGAVTLSATDWTAQLSDAVWRLPDPTSSRGAFVSPTDAQQLAFAAAPATGSRIDGIDVKQADYANGDADSRARVVVTPGNPGAPSTEPAVPAGHWRYATLTVSAGNGNAAAATLTYKDASRLQALSITAPSYALLQLTAGEPGQRAFVTDDPTPARNGGYVWAGAAWAAEKAFISATMTAAKAFASGVQSTVPLDTVMASRGFGALSSGAIVIPQTGIYLAYIEIVWPASSNAQTSGFYMGPNSAGGSVLVSGQVSEISGAVASSWRQSASFIISASAGERIFPIADQNTGATMTVSSAWMKLVKIA
ncbi:MAG TPA: hypothetical protein VGC45_15785 [Gryllotalpicola sp.]